MRILIMMLFNVKLKTFHPIYYMESPLPGPVDSQPVIRFKSKGHHTNGFKNREDALNSIENELLPGLKDYQVFVETSLQQIEWTGEGIPADTELRTNEWAKETKPV